MTMSDCMDCMWDDDRIVRHCEACDDPVPEDLFVHNDYPHTPGTLYGCGACEDECYCGPTTSQCICCAQMEAECAAEGAYFDSFGANYGDTYSDWG